MPRSGTRVDSQTGWGSWPVIVIATVTLLILVPLCLVFVYAFATKWFANHWWWPQEMGTKWILSIFQTDNLINSLVNSYLLATLTTIATIAITFPAAYVLGTRARGLDRLAGDSGRESVEPAAGLPDHHRRPGAASALRRSGTDGHVHRHHALPHDHGRALRAQGDGRELPARAAPEYEEAARNLGATRFYVMRRIYLPLVWRACWPPASSPSVGR